MGLTFALKQGMKVIRILGFSGTAYSNVHGVNPLGRIHYRGSEVDPDPGQGSIFVRPADVEQIVGAEAGGTLKIFGQGVPFFGFQ